MELAKKFTFVHEHNNEILYTAVGTEDTDYMVSWEENAQVRAGHTTYTGREVRRLIQTGVWLIQEVLDPAQQAPIDAGEWPSPRDGYAVDEDLIHSGALQQEFNGLSHDLVCIDEMEDFIVKETTLQDLIDFTCQTEAQIVIDGDTFVVTAYDRTFTCDSPGDLVSVLAAIRILDRVVNIR